MFQKTIAQGRFTLAVVAVFAAIVWVVHGLTKPSSESFDWLLPLGYMACALAVYLMAELNNAFVMLRINSRMLSCVLGMFLTASSFLHTLHAGHAVLLCAVAAYFPLFSAYQRPNASSQTYTGYLFIGLAALAFPPLLMLVPLCWISQIALRSLSLRNWLASLMGVLTPLWLFAGAAYCTDHTQWLLDRYDMLTHFPAPDYAAVTPVQWALFAVVALLFLIGSINFLYTNYLEKTRTRYNYYVVILQGTASCAWMALQPQYFNQIFPLCLIHGAIAGGHFVALSYGRLQNLLTFLFTLILIALTFLAL